MTFIVIDTDTGKEVNVQDINRHSTWFKPLFNIKGWAVEPDGTLLLLDDCGQYTYAPQDGRFRVEWKEKTDVG